MSNCWKSHAVAQLYQSYLLAGVAHIIEVLGMGLGEAKTGNFGFMKTGF